MFKDHKNLIIAVIVLAGIIIFSYFYAFKIAKTIPKKTLEETTKEEAQTLLTAGKLVNSTGTITAVGGDKINIKLSGSNIEGAKELTVRITAKTLIHRIEPAAIPADAKPGTIFSSKETAIKPTDLQVGDTVFVNSNESGEALIIDQMK